MMRFPYLRYDKVHYPTTVYRSIETNEKQLDLAFLA